MPSHSNSRGWTAFLEVIQPHGVNTRKIRGTASSTLPVRARPEPLADRLPEPVSEWALATSGMVAAAASAQAPASSSVRRDTAVFLPIQFSLFIA
jgi:hypothetical protein